MKTKSFFFALMGLISLSACNKNQIKVEYPQQEPQYCELKVAVNTGLVVKSTGAADAVTANEKAVKSLQVFVFRGDFLDAYAKVSTSTLSLTCTAGSRKVYAVVNAPDLSSVSSLDALENTLVDLANNAPNALVMAGVKPVTMPQTEVVTVEVTRHVARIALNKITRAFESTSLGALKFTVKNIYVSDVAGTIKLNGSSSISKWYNSGKTTTDLPSLLHDTVNTDIANNTSYQTPHYFYVMPNDNSTKTTKLVIEVSLGSESFFYPLELPAIERNKSYEFQNVKVLRPGSDDPDIPVNSSEISFTVSVKDWDTIAIDEKII